MIKKGLLIVVIGILLAGCKSSNQDAETANSQTISNEIIKEAVGEAAGTEVEVAEKKDSKFIQVVENYFIKDGQPYYYIGTNYWYGGHLGAGTDADKQRLVEELDQMQALGIKNLRILGSAEGPNKEPWRITPAFMDGPGSYNEQALTGLDYLLSEMNKRDMSAVMVLNNFWPWSGGMAQYIAWSQGDAIPYPPPAIGGDWWKYQLFTSQFYSDEQAITISNQYIAMLINRVNTITKTAYKDDETIMAWELCNEPRAIDNKKDYLKWVKETSDMIHELDANHLVTTGSEGTISNEAIALSEHELEGIDYMTCHIWVENWGWYNPKDSQGTYESGLKQAKQYLDEQVDIAKTIKKPLVLEEFGMARDLGSYDAKSETTMRDQYYQELFQMVYEAAQTKGYLVGANFWAYAGSGRSEEIGGYWESGDDLIGDPPHEIQGWYSVYDTDIATLDVVKEYSRLMDDLVK